LPVVVTSYGAYGSKQWPSFNPSDLSLLDRGWVLAVAHVRGGSEVGAQWHIQGKKMHKKNTFYDFLAAAKHLVERGFTSHDKLAIWGRSAGGWQK
jgi:oligopeptidase B